MDFEREGHDAEISMMSGHSPAYWGVSGIKFEYPISWDKAEELLTVMSRRFKEYTGRTIEEHIAARPPKLGK